MPLLPPKRTAAGFFLSLQPPVTSPELRWTTEGRWADPSAGDAGWFTWAHEQRNVLLGDLLSHGNWFSRPPRHDVLDPLFSPWVSKYTGGGLSFYCKCPEVPGVAAGDTSSGKATWNLQGLIMSSTSIVPVWAISESVKDDAPDTISLFGDGETVDGSDDESEGAGVSGTGADSETREIQIDEIADAPAAGPTRIRNREWEARKFLAKERVREARLKAQIAIHLARKEESRFYTQYGDLDDGESHFSDYDLTDNESGSESGSDSEVDEQFSR